LACFGELANGCEDQDFVWGCRAFEGDALRLLQHDFSEVGLLNVGGGIGQKRDFQHCVPEVAN